MNLELVPHSVFFSSSPAFPFNNDLYCMDYWSATTIGGSSSDGNFLAVMMRDPVTNEYVFFCAVSYLMIC